MIRAEQIPDEVVEAAKTTYTAEIYKGKATSREYHEAMREAIAAGLQAWPGMMPVSEVFTAGGDFYRPHLILPLPQEARDE